MVQDSEKSVNQQDFYGTRREAVAAVAMVDSDPAARGVRVQRPTGKSRIDQSQKRAEYRGYFF